MELHIHNLRRRRFMIKFIAVISPENSSSNPLPGKRTLSLCFPFHSASSKTHHRSSVRHKAPGKVKPKIGKSNSFRPLFVKPDLMQIYKGTTRCRLFFLQPPAFVNLKSCLATKLCLSDLQRALQQRISILDGRRIGYIILYDHEPIIFLSFLFASAATSSPTDRLN